MPGSLLCSSVSAAASGGVFLLSVLHLSTPRFSPFWLQVLHLFQAPILSSLPTCDAHHVAMIATHYKFFAARYRFFSHLCSHTDSYDGQYYDTLLLHHYSAVHRVHENVTSNQGETSWRQQTTQRRSTRDLLQQHLGNSVWLWFWQQRRTSCLLYARIWETRLFCAQLLWHWLRSNLAWRCTMYWERAITGCMQTS